MSTDSPVPRRRWVKPRGKHKPPRKGHTRIRREDVPTREHEAEAKRLYAAGWRHDGRRGIVLSGEPWTWVDKRVLHCLIALTQLAASRIR